MEQMQVRHYLTFEFTGIDDKFVYVVTEEVKNSVQQELLNRSWEISGLVMNSKTPLAVRLRLTPDTSAAVKLFSMLVSSRQKTRMRASPI